MLLYLHSALVRLLLVNVIGLSLVLSGVISLWHVAQSLVCTRAVPSTILDALVSGHRGFVSLENFMHTLSFISDFASSYQV